jgi:hypothetical protein
MLLNAKKNKNQSEKEIYLFWQTFSGEIYQQKNMQKYMKEAMNNKFLLEEKIPPEFMNHFL